MSTEEEEDFGSLNDWNVMALVLFVNIGSASWYGGT